MCGIMFVLSIIQSEHSEKTNAGNSLSSTGDKNDDPCNSQTILQAHRPIRFQVEEDPEYLQCGWTVKNDMIRMTPSLLGIGLAALGIYAILKRKKWVLYLFSLCSFFMVLVYFTAMCLDADDVRKSNGWCSEGLTGISVATPSGSNPTFICSNFPFVLISILDAVASVIWVTVLVLSFRHSRKYMGADTVESMLGEDATYDSLLEHDEHSNR